MTCNGMAAGVSVILQSSGWMALGLVSTTGAFSLIPGADSPNGAATLIVGGVFSLTGGKAFTVTGTNAITAGAVTCSAQLLGPNTLSTSIFSGVLTANTGCAVIVNANFQCSTVTLNADSTIMSTSGSVRTFSVYGSHKLTVGNANNASPGFNDCVLSGLHIAYGSFSAQGTMQINGPLTSGTASASLSTTSATYDIIAYSITAGGPLSLFSSGKVQIGNGGVGSVTGTSGALIYLSAGASSGNTIYNFNFGLPTPSSTFPLQITGVFSVTQGDVTVESFSIAANTAGGSFSMPGSLHSYGTCTTAGTNMPSIIAGYGVVCDGGVPLTLASLYISASNAPVVLGVVNGGTTYSLNLQALTNSPNAATSINVKTFSLSGFITVATSVTTSTSCYLNDGSLTTVGNMLCASTTIVATNGVLKTQGPFGVMSLGALTGIGGSAVVSLVVGGSGGFAPTTGATTGLTALSVSRVIPDLTGPPLVFAFGGSLTLSGGITVGLGVQLSVPGNTGGAGPCRVLNGSSLVTTSGWLQCSSLTYYGNSTVQSAGTLSLGVVSGPMYANTRLTIIAGSGSLPAASSITVGALTLSGRIYIGGNVLISPGSLITTGSVSEMYVTSISATVNVAGGVILNCLGTSVIQGYDVLRLGTSIVSGTAPGASGAVHLALSTFSYGTPVVSGIIDVTTLIIESYSLPSGSITVGAVRATNLLLEGDGSMYVYATDTFNITGLCTFQPGAKVIARGPMSRVSCALGIVPSMTSGAVGGLEADSGAVFPIVIGGPGIRFGTNAFRIALTPPAAVVLINGTLTAGNLYIDTPLPAVGETVDPNLYGPGAVPIFVTGNVAISTNVVIRGVLNATGAITIGSDCQPTGHYLLRANSITTPHVTLDGPWMAWFVADTTVKLGNVGSSPGNGHLMLTAPVATPGLTISNLFASNSTLTIRGGAPVTLNNAIFAYSLGRVYLRDGATLVYTPASPLLIGDPTNAGILSGSGSGTNTLRTTQTGVIDVRRLLVASGSSLTVDILPSASQSASGGSRLNVTFSTTLSGSGAELVLSGANLTLCGSASLSGAIRFVTSSSLARTVQLRGTLPTSMTVPDALTFDAGSGGGALTVSGTPLVMAANAVVTLMGPGSTFSSDVFLAANGGAAPASVQLSTDVTFVSGAAMGGVGVIPASVGVSTLALLQSVVIPTLVLTGGSTAVFTVTNAAGAVGPVTLSVTSALTIDGGASVAVWGSAMTLDVTGATVSGSATSSTLRMGGGATVRFTNTTGTCGFGLVCTDTTSLNTNSLQFVNSRTPLTLLGGLTASAPLVLSATGLAGPTFSAGSVLVSVALDVLGPVAFTPLSSSPLTVNVTAPNGSTLR